MKEKCKSLGLRHCEDCQDGLKIILFVDGNPKQTKNFLSLKVEINLTSRKCTDPSVSQHVLSNDMNDEHVTLLSAGCVCHATEA